MTFSFLLFSHILRDVHFSYKVPFVYGSLSKYAASEDISDHVFEVQIEAPPEDSLVITPTFASLEDTPSELYSYYFYSYYDGDQEDEGRRLSLADAGESSILESHRRPQSPIAASDSAPIRFVSHSQLKESQLEESQLEESQDASVMEAIPAALRFQASSGSPRGTFFLNAKDALSSEGIPYLRVSLTLSGPDRLKYEVDPQQPHIVVRVLSDAAPPPPPKLRAAAFDDSGLFFTATFSSATHQVPTPYCTVDANVYVYVYVRLSVFIDVYV
jgi:hypothetical protein